MTRGEDVLAAAFDFTDADLEANERGQLTDSQRSAIEARRRQRGCGRRVAVVAVAGSLLFLWAVLAADGALSSGSAAPVVAAGLVTIVVVVLVGASMVAGWVRSRDLRSGRVSRVDGVVTTKTVAVRERQMKIGDQYRVELGGVRLLVGSRNQMDAFEPGVRYRVCYVADPPTHHVLSARRLAKGA